jgi:hypothetical protein
MSNERLEARREATAILEAPRTRRKLDRMGEDRRPAEGQVISLADRGYIGTLYDDRKLI